MSRWERKNIDNSSEKPKSSRKKNLKIIISIPVALILGCIGFWTKIYKEDQECDFNLYLEHTDQLLSARLNTLSDTSIEYVNIKFVLDYKHNTIDPFSSESIKKLAKKLQKDLLRVANERSVNLPKPCP